MYSVMCILGAEQTQIMCSILGVFGLFLCFFGHRCFRFGKDLHVDLDFTFGKRSTLRYIEDI